jgi:hypothetical protein
MNRGMPNDLLLHGRDAETVPIFADHACAGPSLSFCFKFGKKGRIENPAVQHSFSLRCGCRSIWNLRGFVIAGHRRDFVHGLVDAAQNILGGEQLFVVLGIGGDKSL